MSLIKNMKILEIDIPEPFYKTMLSHLEQELKRNNIKGIIASGGIERGSTAILNTGIAYIECKNWTGVIKVSDEGMNESGGIAVNLKSQILKHKNQLLLKILEVEPSLQISIHSILVFPDTANLTELVGQRGISVNEINNQSNGIVVCNLNHLHEILANLGDACNAALCINLKTLLLNEEMSSEEVDILSKEIPSYGRRKNIAWIGQGRRVSSWMEGDTSEEVLGSSLLAIANPLDEIDEDEGFSQPERINSLEEELEDEKDEAKSKIEPRQTNNLAKYVGFAGLAIVIASSIYVWRTPDPNQKIDPQQITMNKLANSTIEILDDLDKNQKVPTSSLTPRFTDELANEYVWGKRALWNQQSLKQINQLQALQSPNRDIIVELGLTTIDGATKTLTATWVVNAKGNSWHIDDWQVKRNGITPGNEEVEFPGSKLKCRRDNGLNTRVGGLFSLYSLSPFKDQYNLSSKTFKQLINSRTNLNIDSANTARVYFSSDLDKRVQADSLSIGNLQQFQEPVIAVGPEVWKGKPVYWFSIQEARYSGKPATGVAAFKIENGQVVLEDIRLSCLNR